VRHLRGSLTLELALQALIVTTIVSSVLAAGALLDLLEAARIARWLSLGALAAVAIAYALRRGSELRPTVGHVLAAAFVGLALLSTAWSSDPALTFGRAVTLTAVLVASAAIAIGAAGRPRSLLRVVQAVVAGAAVVALGGLIVLVFAHDRAVLAATAQEAARYQGLGGGPNVAPMVLAVAFPLTAHLTVEARGGRRAMAGAVAVLLLGSIVASGSRGALLSAFAGLFAYALLAASSRRAQALALAGVAALFAASALATRIPATDPTVAALPGTILPDPPIPATGDYLDANVRWRLQEDVGRPPWGQVPAETERSLLGGSGRLQAWEGALRLAAERPAVGYAFGLEDHVFVDRYLEHGSNLPENSYVGLFLQLGIVGVVLFLVLAATLLVTGARASRRSVTSGGRLAAAVAGGLVAGLVLALTQSYLYAAGSNATAAVWLCAFLLPAAAATPDPLPA
jgi:hypothetical protein